MTNNVKQQLWFCIFCIGVLSIMFVNGLAVQIPEGERIKNRSASCIDRLRESMDVMHGQMHAVQSSGQVDEDFVRLMLPHHEAAIEMAKIELLCGKDKVNRRLAQEIIADQQSEIELMRLWLGKHSGPKKSQATQGEQKP